MEKLLEIMRRLRDPQSGCPWDREQDFRSIAPYTIEEAYEVADAIERQDFDGLRDELGDLLFQVVFHARMADEQGSFDFDDVVEAICDKMTRRHPHVFGGDVIRSAADQSRAWEAHKARERRRPAGTGLLAGVPPGLPAMSRAIKLGRLAAGAGFDWPDIQGVLDKLREELGELEHAVAADSRDDIEAELGDLLLAAANLGRHLDIDPEAALRQSLRRFERRFAHVESRLRESGRELGSAALAELEALWSEAKAQER